MRCQRIISGRSELMPRTLWARSSGRLCLRKSRTVARNSSSSGSGRKSMASPRLAPANRRSETRAARPLVRRGVIGAARPYTPACLHRFKTFREITMRPSSHRATAALIAAGSVLLVIPASAQTETGSPATTGTPNVLPRPISISQAMSDGPTKIPIPHSFRNRCRRLRARLTSC
jgi:hypothetical protein